MSIILAQTDTTVGFLSADASLLEEVKSRPFGKEFLKVYPSFNAFGADGNRVPQKYKNFVRRSEKTTFIIKNRASRIVKNNPHLQVLQKYPWLYSTSANKSGHGFNKDFCIQKSDIIVEDCRGFYETTPSILYKISHTNIKKIR
jgi:tRNA A37 threonylcarbamoyladenosine synthetase subunit TsaC/SUA5/YrdC